MLQCHKKTTQHRSLITHASSVYLSIYFREIIFPVLITPVSVEKRCGFGLNRHSPCLTPEERSDGPPGLSETLYSTDLLSDRNSALMGRWTASRLPAALHTGLGKDKVRERLSFQQPRHHSRRPEPSPASFWQVDLSVKRELLSSDRRT